ncbi:MAG: hypothetical protein K6F88_03695 [Ruminococcus sp.]|nr:hypothetical protein [Ruminococcus sp.]
MKTEQLLKNVTPDETELGLINSYARKPLSEDEVYVFSVVLCDNEVDRDFERFTVESLEKLSELFVGKTGIFDHNPTASNQSARIISCKVESVAGKKNSLGDDYFRLVARAYMPISDSNKHLRESIDSGITREVSVGCSVEKTLCSICGEDINSHKCPHVKGETYNSALCYGELTNPTDAYEFSFVAVPAQKGAGVIKAFRKDRPMTEILKSIEKNEAVTLTKDDSKHIHEYIEGLKKQAADGAYYRNSLISDVLKYSSISEPEISRGTMENIVKALSVEELSELRKVYKSKAQKKLPPVVQLFPQKSETKSDKNTEFKI